MTRTLTLAASLAAAVALASTDTADAGNCHRRTRTVHRHHHHHHNHVVRTIVKPPVRYVQPAPVWHWYFGMKATLTSFNGHHALRINHITPGGPACRAGLEPGDLILGCNGFGFQTSLTSLQAVAALQQAVQHGPAGSLTAYGIAQLTVRDLRTGGLVTIMTQPYHNAQGIAPALALR